MKKLFTFLMLIVLASCNTNTNQARTQQAQGVATADNIYNIETAQSQIAWTGREVSTSYHYGTLDFVSGNFEISNGTIVNGEFIVDMTSINNQDMEGDSKARLEGHLKSDDFFSVESYPTAAISINSSELISAGKWNVSADLSIKGFTHPVNFEMISSEDGWSANLVFDRSKYDVRFRSGSFFENLGDKLIYDDIELSITLTTL
ncbi:MAG: YceI family protein [Flavobacteriaceae bacterium]|nr:YceI family protein [Flavobacteriaceae bacterium]MBL6678687.1 YceI family protein [Flavobacteriaceae bacterium]